ncbi:DUF4139 domain-containing protein [Arcicella lustrica]|uniref:DUF4139 domain-containing protein n=1 Tax=Arcicella lustrica TaxID=2984196 RepID=A0ABU5SKH5_9BACT|nr:DUF4139 domain-containing protein [Arcicella sp. DC25W]MEA5427788.1 DUF4139 domain-containing protein [Arcicella sp. DC25W]
MKRTIALYLFSFIVFCGQQTIAQGKKQNVSSKIEQVTVFTSGAQVSRKAKVNLQAGKTELVFSGISPNIDVQSIQVKGFGNFTILSVIHQTNYLNEQKRREETSTLENQQASLKAKLRVEKSMLAVFKNEEIILTKNQSIGGSNTGVKTIDLKEAVDFQRNRLSEILMKQIEYEKTIQKIDSSIRTIDYQLRALNNNKEYATSDILVTVSAKEIGSSSFDVSYFVKKAGWFATYDLRVKDISNPIDLSLKANVYQSSGEDWKDVKLTISNGDPTESGIAPSLEPWYLRFGENTDLSRNLQGRVQGLSITGNEVSGKVTEQGTDLPLPGVMINVKGTTIGVSTDSEGNYSLKLPENAQFLIFNYIGYKRQEAYINGKIVNIALEEDKQELKEEVVVGYGVQRKKNMTGAVSTISAAPSAPLVATEKYQPTTLTFEIEVPYTILNDGKMYSVDIKNQTVPALYEYFAVPKLEKDVFLTAKLIDWQDLNLLEGEVNLYLEGAYLGKSILDVRHAGDTLNISLGRDKGIIIERKRLKEFSTKQFLSNYKNENRGFEISVRNNKQQSINIVIQDQFPISTTKEITVEEQEYKDATLDKESKILTWKYQLPAKQEKKHILKYSVKYPKNQEINLE